MLPAVNDNDAPKNDAKNEKKRDEILDRIAASVSSAGMNPIRDDSVVKIVSSFSKVLQENNKILLDNLVEDDKELLKDTIKEFSNLQAKTSKEFADKLDKALKFAERLILRGESENKPELANVGGKLKEDLLQEKFKALGIDDDPTLGQRVKRRLVGKVDVDADGNKVSGWVQGKSILKNAAKDFAGGFSSGFMGGRFEGVSKTNEERRNEIRAQAERENKQLAFIEESQRNLNAALDQSGDKDQITKGGGEETTQLSSANISPDTKTKSDAEELKAGIRDTDKAFSRSSTVTNAEDYWKKLLQLLEDIKKCVCECQCSGGSGLDGTRNPVNSPIQSPLSAISKAAIAAVAVVATAVAAVTALASSAGAEVPATPGVAVPKREPLPTEKPAVPRPNERPVPAEPRVPSAPPPEPMPQIPREVPARPVPARPPLVEPGVEPVEPAPPPQEVPPGRQPPKVPPSRPLKLPDPIRGLAEGGVDLLERAPEVITRALPEEITQSPIYKRIFGPQTPSGGNGGKVPGGVEGSSGFDWNKLFGEDAPKGPEDPSRAPPRSQGGGGIDWTKPGAYEVVPPRVEPTAPSSSLYQRAWESAKSATGSAWESTKGAASGAWESVKNSRFGRGFGGLLAGAGLVAGGNAIDRASEIDVKRRGGQLTEEQARAEQANNIGQGAVETGVGAGIGKLLERPFNWAASKLPILGRVASLPAIAAYEAAKTTTWRFPDWLIKSTNVEARKTQEEGTSRFGLTGNGLDGFYINGRGPLRRNQLPEYYKNVADGYGGNNRGGSAERARQYVQTHNPDGTEKTPQQIEAARKQEATRQARAEPADNRNWWQRTMPSWLGGEDAPNARPGAARPGAARPGAAANINGTRRPVAATSTGHRPVSSHVRTGGFTSDQSRRNLQGGGGIGGSAISSATNPLAASVQSGQNQDSAMIARSSAAVATARGVAERPVINVPPPTVIQAPANNAPSAIPHTRPHSRPEDNSWLTWQRRRIAVMA